jgi:hypothetical protein
MSVVLETHYARTFARTSGRSGGLEIWWRLHFDDPDFYYRVLASRFCELLTEDASFDAA